jgi:hypothetical protein
MGGVLFIGILMLVVGAVWLARGRAPSRKAMFQRYGVSYFKVLLRQRGVDLSNISDAELAKIVAAKAAKRGATIKDLTDKRFLEATGKSRWSSRWRRRPPYGFGRVECPARYGRL